MTPRLKAHKELRRLPRLINLPQLAATTLCAHSASNDSHRRCPRHPPRNICPQVTVGALGLDNQAHRVASLLLKDLIVSRRNSLFGHVVRLGDDTSAHQAVRRQIDMAAS